MQAFVAIDSIFQPAQVHPMATQKFFDERTDQSETKARIIQKYFYAWARVIGPSAKTRDGKIAYIDIRRAGAV